MTHEDHTPTVEEASRGLAHSFYLLSQSNPKRAAELLHAINLMCDVTWDAVYDEREARRSIRGQCSVNSE